MMQHGGRKSTARPSARAETSRRLARALEGVRGAVTFDASLKALTSFKIGGIAEVLVKPADETDVARVCRQSHDARLPVFVLGGTNVLIRDGGIRGIVVSLSNLKGIRNDAEGVVYAEAGVGMPTLLKHVIKHGLAGLEWAAGIPGTVGGCVVMNAGTRLGEMKDSLKAVRMAEPDGSIRDYLRTELQFEYRRTHLPPGIVVGAWLQLKPATQSDVGHAIKDYLRYRKATQPLTQPNAGCVFKNPSPRSAGHVIEAAGLKGLRVGDAQVSTKHANFIVNLGKASAADVLGLIAEVQRRVRDQSGVELELELKVIGETTRKGRRHV
ncbi:UDP-N-acetylenolpyruvoylglucosamine reductase [Nitrospira sp.]|nr:UDP-N-acetylenolpyruvoylglucosamine reductase [Nitrospira sp.]